MKNLLYKALTKSFNGITHFVQKHPALAYGIGVIPSCILMACGFVALQEGTFCTEDEKEGE